MTVAVRQSFKGSDHPSQIQLNVEWQPLFWRGQQCRVVIFTDTSQYHKIAKMELQTELMNDREASVSHELVTPLKTITMIAQQLINDREFVKQLGKNHKKLNVIYSTCKLVACMVNELLD